MDLEQAVEQADIIAQKNNLGPSDYRHAAMFHTDHNVKTFVELEAGGKDALIEMMEEHLYMPYTWRIRHFKEYEHNQSFIAFTPDGTPYGFIETLSENVTGNNLSEKDARALAEMQASSNWNINFAQYKLVESSQKTEISNRIDHTFVYERTDKKIGEGTYRLKIVVSGDKITELTHFVKVPEAFTRRYVEMRSANAVVSLAAMLLMILLYFFGGGIVGLYWIIRKRWHLLKQSFLCALALALLSVLASVNQLPFLWMQYNSAITLNSFLARLFLTLLVSLIGQTALYTIIIAAAEGLTRRAFGNHPQLWSVFSAENSTSRAIMGRIFGSYLLVGFNVAFVIGFYLFSLRYLGWWSPSEMLFDPNSLATYAPWFSPLAQSLNAGFIEECLFRAIPLAGAALLGNYFGKRNWWIGTAFIVQALIFGAAHANYPVQPSYARLLELLIPSFIWGAIYLRFGLLSTIIAHFVYDVIWFSIPIFITNTSDTFSYKLLIIIGALLPLLRVGYAYLRNGGFKQFDETARNNAWQPSLVDEEKEEEVVATKEHSPSSPFSKKLICILGILGLAGWMCTTRFTHDGIQITLNKDEAVAQANAFLEQKNSPLIAPWKTLPLVFTNYALIPQIAQQHKFIWKKGKKELYHHLLGTYLEPAHWTIRYAQFDTDIIERTEEHKVMLDHHGISRYHHQLPESALGASLTQEQARLLAHQVLREQFNLDPAALTEISAVQAQLPHRINWSFIFSNPAVYPLQTGQARISILISGSEVIDAACFIHVPEEWQRKEQNKQNTLGIMMLVFALILVLSLFVALIIASKQKRTFIFSKRLFFLFSIISMIFTVIEIINVWPSIIGSFNTSLPLQNQLFQTIAAMVIQLCLKSVFYGLFFSYVLSLKSSYASSHHSTTRIIIGTCTGFFITGLLSIAQSLLPSNMPLWPSYDALGYNMPLLASLWKWISYYAHITLSCSLLYMLVDTVTAQWQKNRIFFTFIAAVLGMSFVDVSSIKQLPLWIMIGICIGYIMLELYKRIIRYDYSLIPLITGTYVISCCIRQGTFNAYPNTWLAVIISIVTIEILSIWWHGYIRKND